MPNNIGFCLTNGGQGGIRTLDTGSPYTHFPGVRLRPLGHLSTRLEDVGLLYLFANPQLLVMANRGNWVHLDRGEDHQNHLWATDVYISLFPHPSCAITNRAVPS